MVSSTLRLQFTPGKDPVPILQEAGFSVCVYIYIYIYNLGIFLSITENIPTEDRKCIHKSKPIFISWYRIDDGLGIIPKFNYKPQGFERLSRYTRMLYFVSVNRSLPMLCVPQSVHSIMKTALPSKLVQAAMHRTCTERYQIKISNGTQITLSFVSMVLFR